MAAYLMDDELEKIWKEAIVAYMTYDPGIGLEKQRKTTKYLSQDIRRPRRDLNRPPPPPNTNLQRYTIVVCDPYVVSSRDLRIIHFR
jgi:hypothetical protein